MLYYCYTLLKTVLFAHRYLDYFNKFLCNGTPHYCQLRKYREVLKRLNSPQPSHFKNLTQTCKLLNVFWTLSASKRRDKRAKQFISSKWPLNFCNFSLLNSSITCEMVLKYLFFLKNYKNCPVAGVFVLRITVR